MPTTFCEPALTRADATQHEPTTVLVVDDDKAVRSLICAVLGRARYKILEAESGLAALQFCEDFPGPIRLMITDLTMPGMDGVELCERFRRLRPEARTLLLSGCASEDVRPGCSDVLPFLQKPFLPPDLLQAVRHVIGGEKSA